MADMRLVHLSQGIARRLAVREKARLQMLLVRAIYQRPVGASVILRGGAALHRVYLDRRWSEDLDLIVPSGEEDRVYEALVEQGFLTSVRRGGATCRGAGLCFPMLDVNLDILRSRGGNCAVLGLFRGLDGEVVQVAVPPLPDILIGKLHCLTTRPIIRATDFADLWWGLPPFLAQSRVLRDRVAGRWGTDFFDAQLALDRLALVRDSWEASLQPLTVCVPDYNDVRSDLATWLPLFEAAS